MNVAGAFIAEMYAKRKGSRTVDDQIATGEGLDVERLARAIDDTPTAVFWRVSKGDRFEAVRKWAADIEARYRSLAATTLDPGEAE